MARESTILWKEWPLEMEARSLGHPQEYRFSLSGICPHCDRPSVFMMVTTGHAEAEDQQTGLAAVWAGMQCQGCLKYLLACVHRHREGQKYAYLQHFPLGKPKDDVAPEVPTEISGDFKEALRCRWVDAYNATGEMCRRALESSCNEQKAPTGKKLVEKIDWLAGQGKITGALKDVAHKIRLGGNYGAHAPEDPLNAAPMTAEHADALIEFMRDYFQHLYVIPKKLAQYDFTKAGMTKPVPPTP